jgi:replicative DNA helicase
MFIHREDKYDKNSDRPNIAKIMIEKHRNGPTGSVELYFDDKTTSFMPIETGNMDDFSASAKDEGDLDSF